MKSSRDADIARPNPDGKTAGVIEVMAHSGWIPETARIRLILLGGGPPTRLTSGFVPEPSCPPVGGNDSPSSVSHSRPIFTSSWHFDSEMAIWDSPAWGYDRKRLGNVLHRQPNVFWNGNIGGHGLAKSRLRLILDASVQ